MGQAGTAYQAMRRVLMIQRRQHTSVGQQLANRVKHLAQILGHLTCLQIEIRRTVQLAPEELHVRQRHQRSRHL